MASGGPKVQLHAHPQYHTVQPRNANLGRLPARWLIAGPSKSGKGADLPCSILTCTGVYLNESGYLVRASTSTAAGIRLRNISLKCCVWISGGSRVGSIIGILAWLRRSSLSRSAL